MPFDVSRDKYDEYGRSLLSVGDERLERRVNRVATRLAQLRGGRDNEARVRNYEEELCALSLQLFRVVGQGMAGSSVDEVLLDVLMVAMRAYDPARGPFANYVRFLYKRRTLDAGRAAGRVQDVLVSMDDAGWEDALGDGRMDIGPDNIDGDGDDDEAIVVSFLGLLNGFLSHADDRAHTERTRIYLRMIASERITYVVKSLPHIGYCEPFERHEREAFAAVELGFLDVYMSEVCRAIRVLYQAELREGYGEIVKMDDPRLQGFRPPAPWKLETSVYRAYLEETYGIKVSAAVISQQRSRFNALIRQIEPTLLC